MHGGMNGSGQTVNCIEAVEADYSLGDIQAKIYFIDK